MIILSILFFVTAILYASVGFGGGSTYLALMLIWDIPYYIFPVIALICNIFVVSGNSFNYIKAGILLSDFYDDQIQQYDFFYPKERTLHSDQLMNTIDKINKKGLPPVYFLAQGIKRKWSMKREIQSPRYTTSWNDLPKVS